MSIMVCSICNKIGIHWVGPCGNLTGTKCPHCGGTNCQRCEQLDEQCSECGDTDCNGQCAGDDMLGSSG